METKLKRIAELAREDKQMKFTSLAHLLNVENLTQCHRELPTGKATGVLGETKESCGMNLKENLERLVEEMKNKQYRPVPVRRTYIPKDDKGNKRPLGIPEHEDKIVQRCIAKILNAIYEQDFLDSSFGFRPNRNCHDALKILNVYIEKKNINYIVDVDIASYFDRIDHKWMMEFLSHRIADRSLLRIIGRFLKGGYVEEAKKYKTLEGAPQGGLISPIMSNIYLHYVLDLWFEKHVRQKCRGEAYIVRYADDFVCCFEYEEEAQAFYKALKGRLEKFGLEVSESKTKIIPFGRKAEKESQRTKGSKPETFDFLGFTHYCSKSQRGAFRVKRKTSNKKLRMKLKQWKQWVKKNRNMDMVDIMKRLKRSLTGYYNYYCITDNSDAVTLFMNNTVEILFKWMNRRSQRKSFTWEKFQLFLARYPLPKPYIKVSIYDLRNHISYIL